MPTRRTFDSAAVDALLRRNDGIAVHADLKALRVPDQTICRFINAGPWRRVFPGVVVGHRGPITRRQARLATLAYAGQDAVLSGEHALELLGITGDRISVGDQILVVVPVERKRASTGFVTVERTRRPPRVLQRGGLPVVTPARAAADAARHCPDLDRVREIFSAVLQQRRCTLTELQEEVYDGPTQRRANARLVLGEVEAGVRSVWEAHVKKLVDGSGLPRPVWNEPVVIDGRFVAEADAYWPTYKVAMEVDGMRWHSTPADLRRTQAKQRRYSEHGVLLFTVAPTDVRSDPDGFLRQLTATLIAAGWSPDERWPATPDDRG